MASEIFEGIAILTSGAAAPLAWDNAAAGSMGSGFLLASKLAADDTRATEVATAAAAAATAVATTVNVWDGCCIPGSVTINHHIRPYLFASDMVWRSFASGGKLARLKLWKTLKTYRTDATTGSKVVMDEFMERFFCGTK